MQFKVLESHFRNCQTHLDDTRTHNTAVESYLVQYLLTRICAEYESRIRTLIERRCSRIKDPYVKRFARRSAQEVTKKFRVSDIKGVLGRFGELYVQKFHDSVVDKPPHTAWDNIYNNRQAVAHDAGAQMSFDELKKSYEDSLTVLDSIVGALGLKPRHIRDLK
jgi:hypothetical protein